MSFFKMFPLKKMPKPEGTFLQNNLYFRFSGITDVFVSPSYYDCCSRGLTIFHQRSDHENQSGNLEKTCAFLTSRFNCQTIKISKIDSFLYFMYLFLFLGFNIIICIKLRAQGPKRAQKGPHILY